MAKSYGNLKNSKYLEISEALSSEYESIFYVNIQDDSYSEYHLKGVFKSFGLATSGTHFFDECVTNLQKICYPEDLYSMLQAINKEKLLKHLSNHSSYSIEYRLVLKNKPIHYRLKVLKLHNEDNYIIIAVSNIEDEIKQRLHIQKEMEKNLQIIQVLASEYSSVYYINLKTDALTPYSMNEEIQNEFGIIFQSGINFSAAFDMYVNSLVVPEDRKEMLEIGTLENIRKELKNNKTFIWKFRSKKQDGPHYCEMKFVKVGDDKDFPKAAVLGIADKDKEIRNEQERQKELMDARLKAEEASASKSKFLFSMSHDIRTPMNAIMGFSSMAKKFTDNPEKIKDCLEKIELSGQHLLQLINDILDMSRIESGTITLEEKEVDLISSSKQLITLVQEGVDHKNISLELNFLSIANQYIYADILHVNQVLINILSNAVKYTKEGGKVIFTVVQTESTKPGYGAYNFIIEDNGIGMSKEFLGHIFDSFSREKSTTVSGIQGTGLGMSIAKQLVDMMGGTITIASELGVGTTVNVHLEFRLRENKPEEKPITPIIDNSKALKNKRVLLVEDNELNREIAIDILQEQELIIEEANDGSVAVNMVKTRAPNYYDFILMDIQMPILDGYEATKQIRAFTHDDYSKLPIIAMTANAFEEDKKNAFMAGMNAHVPKPINVEELFKVMISLDKIRQSRI